MTPTLLRVHLIREHSLISWERLPKPREGEETNLLIFDEALSWFDPSICSQYSQPIRKKI